MVTNTVELQMKPGDEWIAIEDVLKSKTVSDNISLMRAIMFKHGAYMSRFGMEYKIGRRKYEGE